VLVEGEAKKADASSAQQLLTGRTDENKRILFSQITGAETLRAGDFATVQVTGVTGHTLRGHGLRKLSGLA
jgi:tRNA A37 methylthiotransferase MiaB